MIWKILLKEATFIPTTAVKILFPIFIISRYMLELRNNINNYIFAFLLLTKQHKFEKFLVYSSAFD